MAQIVGNLSQFHISLQKLNSVYYFICIEMTSHKERILHIEGFVYIFIFLEWIILCLTILQVDFMTTSNSSSLFFVISNTQLASSHTLFYFIFTTYQKKRFFGFLIHNDYSERIEENPKGLTERMEENPKGLIERMEENHKGLTKVGNKGAKGRRGLK